MQAIKAGDVVRLKSGGPAMTVSSVGEGAAWGMPAATMQASCMWFDKGDVKEKTFPVEMLEPDDGPTV